MSETEIIDLDTVNHSTIEINKKDVNLKQIKILLTRLDKQPKEIATVFISKKFGIYRKPKVNNNYKISGKVPEVIEALRDGNKKAKELFYIWDYEEEKEESTRRVSGRIFNINKNFVKKLNFGNPKTTAHKLIINYANGYGFNTEYIKINFED